MRAIISAFLLPSRGTGFAVDFLGPFGEAATFRLLPALFACAFFGALTALAPFVGFPALRAFVGLGASLLAAARGWRAFQIRAAAFGPSLESLLLPGMLFQISMRRSAGPPPGAAGRAVGVGEQGV